MALREEPFLLPSVPAGACSAARAATGRASQSPLIDLDDLLHQAPEALVVGNLALCLVQRGTWSEVGRNRLARDLLAEDLLLSVAGVARAGARAIWLAALVTDCIDGPWADVTDARQVRVHPLRFALKLWEVG